MRKLLLAALLFLAPASAEATICPSIPYTFTAGTVIDPTQVNTNFSTFQACVNANAANVGANGTITSLSALTSLTDSGPGSFGSLSVSGTSSFTGIDTHASDINMSGTGELLLASGTTGQRTGSPVVGDMRYNLSLYEYEAYWGSEGWQPLTPPQPPGGRLALATGTPVPGASVSSATLYYTPYTGAYAPLWNGLTFNTMFFSEATLALGGLAANSCYDIFLWNNAGSVQIINGPAWTNTTTRSAGTALVRQQGMLVNNVAIVSGPAQYYGLYLGSICTDVGAAAVTFAPQPAAASGGPSTGTSNPGAWVGLWNEYNRVLVTLQAQDSKASWSYASNSWGTLDGANNNRATVVVGLIEDSYQGSVTATVNGSSTIGGIGCGINSTSSPSLMTYIGGSSIAAAQNVACALLPSTVGENFMQALQAGATTFYGQSPGTITGQAEGLALASRY